MAQCPNCESDRVYDNICLNCGKIFPEREFVSAGELLFYRGKAAFQAEDYDGAIKELIPLFKPDSANLQSDVPEWMLEFACEYLAVACREKCRYNEAVEYAAKEIERKPESERAYESRALAYSGAGRYEEAIADYTRAIELAEAAEYLSSPTLASLYKLRACAYKQTGQFDKAISDMDNALKFNEDSLNIDLYSIMDAIVTTDSDGNVISLHDSAQSDLYSLRAEIHEAAGDYQKAIEDCKEALQHYPAQASAKEILARCESNIKE